MPARQIFCSRVILWLTVGIFAGSCMAKPAPAQGLPGPPGVTGPQGVGQSGFFGGGNAVVINQPGIGDPYAMPGGPGFGNWFSGGPGLAPAVRDRLWFRGEYLLWWTDRMESPPLITTSPEGTPQSAAGVLGEPGTSVLFGDGPINDRVAHGFLASAGFWLTPQGAFAIEGEYFRFGDQKGNFSRSGEGSPIIARPLFDMTRDAESSQLVSFPDLVAGNVRAGATSRLESFLVNGRVAMLPLQAACFSCNEPDRVDWLIGYRHLRLDEGIAISESLRELDVVPPGSISLAESFEAENRFHGLQLGVVHRANFRRAWLESLIRVAIGNNAQRVRIAGNTTLIEGETRETFPGGLLAQNSNIGTYRRDEFTMIPEIGLTLGIRVTDWLHATVGYSLLYFPNVVRAGDQIDTDVNPNQFPPPLDPLVGSARPRFSFVETSYWAHGLHLGGEIRF